MPFNPSRCEFSPVCQWNCKNNIHTRIYRTPFESGTERICTITPAKDGCFSFHIVEMSKDLSLVEVIGTSAGRGYSRSLTRVMSFCDKLASKVFKQGREPTITQPTLSL